MNHHTPADPYTATPAGTDADPYTDTTPDDSAGLRAAVARLTDALAGQAGDPGEGCLQCYGEEEIAELRDPHAPLADDLVQYTARDLAHWPNPGEAARRVLPRLAALMAEGEHVCELEGNALHQADWQTWPQKQADAVRVFLDAYWTTALRRTDPAAPVDDVFAFCSLAHGTPAPYLARWARERSPAADAHLTDTAGRWLEDLLLDALDPAHPLWHTDPEPEPDTRLRAWLLNHAAPRLRRTTTDADLLHTLDRLESLGLPAAGKRHTARRT